MIGMRTYSLEAAIKLSPVHRAVNTNNTISVDALDGIVDIDNHLFLLGEETPLAYIVRFLHWKGVNVYAGWIPSQPSVEK